MKTKTPGRLLLISSLALTLAACGQGTPSTRGTTSATSGPRPWAAYLQRPVGPLSLEQQSLYDLALRADWLANRPEVQEPEALEALSAHWQEPTFLAETEESYYEPESPATPPATSDTIAVAGDGSLTPQVIPIICDDPYAIDCEPYAPPPPPAPPTPSPLLSYIKGVAWGSVDNYRHEYANQWLANSTFPGQLDWTRDGCSVPIWLAFGAAAVVPGIIVQYQGRFEPACNLHDFGYRNLKVHERTEANRERTDDVFLGNMRHICRQRPWYQRPICRAAAWTYHQAVRRGARGSFFD